jgi:hypothetical protein
MAEPELGEQLLAGLTQLDGVANAIPDDEAARRFDEATLQVFWRDWPRVSAWAGALWRTLNQDLAQPARPTSDSDLDEVGGSG